MRIGVLGGSSFLGEHLLRALAREGHQVVAFSRQGGRPCQEHVTWLPAETWPELCLDAFVSLAPAWVLPDYLERLASAHVKCVVVLSSTSRFTKQASPDPRERALAQRLVDAEQRLQQWADEHNTQWAVLRPTLIYGHGKDKSICEIARFIQRYGFFPLIGNSAGLRQPVHCDDIVQVCVAALETRGWPSGSYNLSGAQTLPYHAMVRRVFQAVGRPERTLNVPAWLLRQVIVLARCLPRYRHLSSAMAQRMSQDLTFDNSAAREQFGFAPRAFDLSAEDLPPSAKKPAP